MDEGAEADYFLFVCLQRRWRQLLLLDFISKKKSIHVYFLTAPEMSVLAYKLDTTRDIWAHRSKML